MALIIVLEGAEVCRLENKQTDRQTDMCCHAFVLSTLAAGSVRYMHKASNFHHQRLLSNVKSRY